MKRREIENRVYDQAMFSAWDKGLADAARNSDTKQQLLLQERELLPQFTEQYQKLASLPRRARRELQRQWKRSLAGIALLLALGAQPALAATINVGGQCTLARAIVSANNDLSPGGFCSPGRGADRIILRRNSTHTLTRVDNTNYGPAGLPTIRSDITIVGNGGTIRRAPRAPRFRIFSVNANGNLTLQRSTVSGGIIRGPEFDYRGKGGGVVVLDGVLNLINSTLSGNLAASGGGVYCKGGSVALVNSTITRNTGDGMRGFSADFRLMNSTASNNRGEGVNTQQAKITISNSTISGNTGTGVFGALGNTYVNNSTISGNGFGIAGAEAKIEIANSTITRNVRGGLSAFTYTDTNITRTIVSGNGRAEVQVDFEPGSGVSASNFNIIGLSGNARSIRFTPGTTDIVPTQPLAGVLNTRLANNGGATLTHALVNGSPAIDAVNDGTCPPPATDQRGLSRPRDGNRDGGVACDIGAIEALGPPGMPGAAPAPVPQQPAPVDPGPVDPGPIDPDPMNPAPMNPDSSVPPEESSDDMGMPPPAS